MRRTYSVLVERFWLLFLRMSQLYWCNVKVLSSETIPSSVALIDPNLRNLVDEVAIKVNAHL